VVDTRRVLRARETTARGVYRTLHYAFTCSALQNTTANNYWL
jgi:hypothetical protein